jgi:hypothetical protein
VCLGEFLLLFLRHTCPSFSLSPPPPSPQGDIHIHHNHLHYCTDRTCWTKPSRTPLSLKVCPSTCRAAPIQRMFDQLDGPCNVSIGNILDQCVKPTMHCSTLTCERTYNMTKGTVTKAWNLFDSLNKLNRGPIEFHCGDNKVGGYGTGTGDVNPNIDFAVCD